jgi:serine/threonine protein kinase
MNNKIKKIILILIFFPLYIYSLLNEIPKIFRYKNTKYEYIADGNEKIVYRELNYSPKAHTKIKLLPIENNYEKFDVKFDIEILPQKILLKFKKTDDPKDSEDKYNKELNILLKLKNEPNIVKILGYKIKRKIIILENAKADLLDILNQKNLTLLEKIKIIRDIAYGIKSLHDNNIFHGDIKPENILIFDDNTAKICDFSNSEILSTNKKKLYIDTVKGTFTYISPNIYSQVLIDKSKKIKISLKDDIYAFGMVIYLIMHKKDILEELKEYLKSKSINLSENKRLQIGQFANSLVHYNWRPSLESLNKDNNIFNTLIKSCWVNDPKDRPDIDNICNYLDNFF